MRWDSERREDEEVGLGLRFFNADTPPEQRRRRWIFVCVSALVASMVLWPVYPLFAHPEPLILGLPLALAWVIAALIVAFGALVWLYRGEPLDENDG